MLTRSTTTSLACAGAVAAATLLAGAAGAERPTSPTLTRCGGALGTLGARCGSIRVPLDRTNPGAGTTSVAFALVPRRDSSRPALGTVVLSSGPIIAAGAEYAQGL